MSEKPLNLGEEADVKAHGKKVRLAARRRADVVRSVWSSPQGREYMWELMGASGVGKTPFTPGDPYATAFNAGAQNLGLSLLSEVQATCPELYLQAMQEAHKRKEEA